VRSKESRIQEIQSWLNAGSGSIANYAICTQFASELKCAPKDPKCELLSKASFYQFQAEKCYKQYITEIKSCNLSDQECLTKFQHIDDKCFALAKTSLSTIKKVNFD